ncbi:MAG: glycosyltransferase family 39 protein [Desulfomonilaceae bacterium]
MTSANYHARILAIIVVAFILRLAFPLIVFGLSRDIKVFYNNDTMEYVAPAESLIASGRYAANGQPEIERTPGYSILFIPGIVLGSIGPVTIALQIVLSCFSVFMVYQIGILLFDKREIAILSAALYAVEPVSIIYASMLYSETLYASVFLIFLYFLLKYLKTHAPSDIVLSAVAVAATAYVRPISYFIPFLIAFALVSWTILRRTVDRKLLLHTAAFFVISMSLIAVWQVRNKIEAGYPGFSAISDQNLYFYVGGEILAKKNGITPPEERKRMGYGEPATYFSLHPEQRTWSRNQIYRYRAKEGIKLAEDNPWTFFKLFVQTTIETLRETGATELLQMVKIDPDSSMEARLKWILKLPLFVVLLMYWLLAFIGVLSKRWSNETQLMILIVLAAYFILVAAVGGVGYSRLRHPVMPIVSLMAGCGLFSILERLKPSTH